MRSQKSGVTFLILWLDKKIKLKNDDDYIMPNRKISYLLALMVNFKSYNIRLHPLKFEMEIK